MNIIEDSKLKTLPRFRWEDIEPGQVLFHSTIGVCMKVRISEAGAERFLAVNLLDGSNQGLPVMDGEFQVLNANLLIEPPVRPA